LKSIAHELSQVAKRSVDLCARYGGEEFTLLFPNTTQKDPVTIQIKKEPLQALDFAEYLV